MPLPREYQIQLAAFIEMCQSDPSFLHTDELAFFREYIESLGGKIPPKPSSPNAGSDKSEKPKAAEPAAEPMEEESDESEVELDLTGVIEPAPEEPQPMGDPDKEVSEEDIEKSNEKRQEAVEAYSLGEFETAVKLYTEAILLNPTSAALFTKRGQCFLQLNQLVSCDRDCTHALELNPDSAAAFKYRGRARRLLGQWSEAASDLRAACKIDFDEQADEWLREVTPNARKLEMHKIKWERKRSERELKQRRERARAAAAAHAAAAAQASSATASSTGAPTPGPGGFPENIFEQMFDDDMKTAYNDPEVRAALMDIMKNPANVAKYSGNPKVTAALAKLSAKMQSVFGGSGGEGGEGGFPGFPGVFPGGFPGAFPGAADLGGDAPPRMNTDDDVGLD